MKEEKDIDEKTLTTSLKLPDRLRTGMIIPTSEKTYFNTNWKPTAAPLCAYDMLYHPPDYNPKSARSDRQEPKIIRKNIWVQELQRRIPSTTHFVHGRPTWPILDRPTKQFVRIVVKNENPHMRINHILEWAEVSNQGLMSLCM
ncbi:hypothetical protein HW555_013024 [Spodoptera exigua]|uniref:Uncharacterized protein n=1 Tax=Spodoptera exigua TaxID=7107 RepID=A0A835G6B3_SPOEX|nr:hypothetical protein HW555_013077 [Spodoptera exigua]KAF9406676.1 hypothetical protein HW555_013024 [Spodoptera exigua]KAH9637945.1 hypothetical protein HF086_003647 [Spodoptera exigua]